MASGRPDNFGGGGGGLGNKIATLVDYKFVTVGPFQGANGEFSLVKFIPTLLLDGATEPRTPYLKVGDAANFAGISEDGHTLYFTGRGIGAKSEAGIFLASAFKADSHKDQWADTEGEANYENLVGQRMLLVNIPNGKTETGKDGRTYDSSDLTVGELYGGAAKAANGDGKSNGKTATTAAEAQFILDAIIAKGPIANSNQLRVKLAATLGKNPNRQAIEKQVLQLATQQGVVAA